MTTYTLANFIERLPIREISNDLDRNEQLSGMGNGQILAAELAPPLYGGSISLREVPYADYPVVRSLIKKLDGVLNAFEIYSPPLLFPRNDPTGSILGSALPTIHTLGVDNKTIRFTGLPAGYTLKEGDQFCYDIGNLRVFHELMADTTASSGGLTPLVEIRPFLFPGSVVGTAVTFKKPTMRAVMVPGSFRKGVIKGQFVYGVGFDFKQRLKS